MYITSLSPLSLFLTTKAVSLEKDFSIFWSLTLNLTRNRRQLPKPATYPNSYQYQNCPSTIKPDCGIRTRSLLTRHYHIATGIYCHLRIIPDQCISRLSVLFLSLSDNQSSIFYLLGFFSIFWS